MLAALSVVFLYLTSVLPTGGLALSALAGILASVTCLECGFFWAAAHYAVCCALALLLAPEKTYVLWYVFALGLYGILKLPIEGEVASLNVAQAATACMYEWLRQNY